MPRKKKKPRKSKIKTIRSGQAAADPRPQSLRDVALRTRPALMASALITAMSDRRRDDHD